MFSKRSATTTALALCIAALFAAGTAGPASAESRFFLDFDWDDDPWTIQTTSPYHSDEVAMIIEVGEDPIPAGTDYQVIFVPLEYCYEPPPSTWWCYLYPDPGWPGTSDWCNPDLNEDCWWDAGVGDGCEPPAMSGRTTVDLLPGERYVIGRIEVGFRFCGYDGRAGHFTVMDNLADEWADVMTLDPGTASAPEDGGPDGTTMTFGRIKSLYRD